MFGLSYFLQFVAFALIFFLAAVFILNNAIAAGDSLAAIFLIIFAGISAGNCSIFLPDLGASKVAAKKLFSILDLEDEHQLLDKVGSKKLQEPIKGNIQFVDVCFKYENREALVLNNFSMSIKEGQSIGLVGSSGCGKSTIFSLLLGFYYPDSGNIYIEGIDIKDYDLQHLRRSFGVVSQEPLLFN